MLLVAFHMLTGSTTRPGYETLSIHEVSNKKLYLIETLEMRPFLGNLGNCGCGTGGTTGSRGADRLDIIRRLLKSGKGPRGGGHRKIGPKRYFTWKIVLGE